MLLYQGWYFIITLDNELLYNNAVMSGLVFYSHQENTFMKATFH